LLGRFAAGNDVLASRIDDAMFSAVWPIRIAFFALTFPGSVPPSVFFVDSHFFAHTRIILAKKQFLG
jgi:hypothetical protein